MVVPIGSPFLDFSRSKTRDFSMDCWSDQFFSLSLGPEREGLIMDIAVSKKLDKVFPYLMLLPAIVLFIMFVISPFFYGFYTSLFRWDGLSEMKWLGFTNYKHVFADPQFWNAIKNTFVYAIVITVFKNGIGLALALMLISRKHGTTFCRTALYMPVTFSYVVIGVLWIWVYNPTFGILDGVLDLLGLESLSQGWLSDPDIALYSVAAVDIWKWIGFHLVLYYTGAHNHTAAEQRYRDERPPRDHRSVRQ